MIKFQNFNNYDNFKRLVLFCLVFQTKTANFELPPTATTNGSLCEEISLLKLNFGNGHSWSMNFTNNNNSYQADTITFSYYLNDTTLFPNSSSTGNFYISSCKKMKCTHGPKASFWCCSVFLSDAVTVTVKPDIKNVLMDTCYSCKSKDTIQSDTVNQTLWNVLIQAFVKNNSKSENSECRYCSTAHPALNISLLLTLLLVCVLVTVTSCAADVPATTVAPTTHGTNSTTVAPTTNATSTAPPTTATPAPTLPVPTTGKYSINSSDTGANCLLANFGLRIGLQIADVCIHTRLEIYMQKISCCHY